MEEVRLAIINLKTVCIGDKVIVKGRVAPGARRFSINLGQDDSNFAIHFNPRFDQSDGVIVINSRVAGQWGFETRVSQFPFQEGEDAEISFLFEGKKVKVDFPNEFVYNSELNLKSIEYISVVGDFMVRSIRVE